MNKNQLATYLERIDATLHDKAILHIYGSAAFILLALYQARARAFGMVGFINRLRQRLNRPPLTAREVPGHLVRDIGLPPLARGDTARWRATVKAPAVPTCPPRSI